VTAPNAASTPVLSIRPRALARRSTIPLVRGAAPRLQLAPANAPVDLGTASYAPIPPRIATNREARRLPAPD
jgi:hypothetical protein